jgi:hypothetical protein
VQIALLSLFLSRQDGDQLGDLFSALTRLAGFESVLHAGINVVIDNQCFQTTQGRARGLHLSYHVDAVTILGHHFAHGPDLALYARKAGVCFALRLVSHLHIP